MLDLVRVQFRLKIPRTALETKYKGYDARKLVQLDPKTKLSKLLLNRMLEIRPRTYDSNP